MTTASEAYVQHLTRILAEGSLQTARGLSFLEVIAAQYVVPMRDPVILMESRNLGLRFAVAEPFWILSGGNLLSEIKDYGKMAPYSDDGYFMSGAYGPKIVDQLGYICKTLADDQGSRQAVINIWRERPGKSKDIPCTLSLQFMIRNDKLECIATMRSSDAWLGLPYDSILFSLTSAYVLSILREHYNEDSLSLGSLHLTMGSAHIYDRDIDKVKALLERPDSYVDEVDFDLLSQVTPPQFLLALDLCRANDRGILGVRNYTDRMLGGAQE